MAHFGQHFLNKQAGVAKGGVGQGGGLFEGAVKLVITGDLIDPPAPAAAFCLEHDGQPYFFYNAFRLFDGHGAV